MKHEIVYRARRCFGLAASASGCLTSCHDDHLAYLAGSFVVLTNTKGSAPALLPLSADAITATALAACASLPLLAVAESSAGKPTIAVYDSVTRLKKKTLTMPSSLGTFECFKSVSISSDGQYVAALALGSGAKGSDTASILAVWAWEGGKIVASTPIIPENEEDNSIECAFMEPDTSHYGNNQEPTTISVIGTRTCRLFVLGQGDNALALKPLQRSVGRRECNEFTCQTWLVASSCGTLAVGAANGDLLFIQGGYVRCTLSLAQGSEVSAIAPLRQGGLAALAGDSLYVINPQDSTDNRGRGAAFDVTHVLSMSPNLATPAANATKTEPKPATKTPLRLTALSDSIIIGKNNQLLKLDTSRGIEEDNLEALETFQTEAVNAVSCCSGRPLAATLSSDARRLLLHNLETGNTDLAVVLVHGDDPPTCVHVHPGGHMLLLASGRSLVLHSIMADGLTPQRSFLLKERCCGCAFSSGGHYMAAVTNEHMIIWNTYSGELVTKIQGFIGSPHSLHWGRDDASLLVGSSQGVWAWSTPGGTLIGKYEVPADADQQGDLVSVIPNLSTPGDGDRAHFSVFAATKSRTLLEINFQTVGVDGDGDAQPSIVRQADAGHDISALALTRGGLHLATMRGAVVLFPLPLGSSPAGKPQRCGAGVATCVAPIGCTDALLVGHADGSVTLITDGAPLSFSLNDEGQSSSVVEGFSGRSGRGTIGGDDTLVRREELRSLRIRLRQQNVLLVDAVKDKTVELESELAALSSNLLAAKVEAAAVEEEAKMAAAARDKDRAQQEAQHVVLLKAAEKAFERRLAVMDDKLSAKLHQGESQNEALQRQIDAANEELQKHRETAQVAASVQIAAAVSELEHTLTKFQGDKDTAERQLGEARAAWEVERMKLEATTTAKLEESATRAEAYLAKERASVQHLRGEVALAKHRAEEQRLDAAAARGLASQSATEAGRLKAEVEGLRRDLSGVKAELQERENMLMAKEILIQDVTDRERALDSKRRAVEEALAAAQQGQADNAAQLQSLHATITDLKAENKALVREKTAVERAAEGRKQREHAARCEAGRRQATLESTRRHLQRIQADIQAAAASIQNPKELKEAVVKLYHAHVTEEQSGSNAANSQEQQVVAVAGEDMEVEYLRGTIERLRHQLRQQQEAAVADKRRNLGENKQLMAEIHKLQEEISGLKRRQATLSAHGTKKKGAYAGTVVEVAARVGGVVIKEHE